MTIELKTETHALACSLTHDEVLVRADELATTVQEISQEEERQSNLKAQLKATMAELVARQGKLAHIVSRREEYRDVEVVITINEDGSKISEIRKETGEVILQRAPRDSERQLFLDEFDRRTSGASDSKRPAK